ncbi:hypothetical protein [Klenkia brasiliensis]|uniref:Trypsin-like peptidase domain-containing protein n=1 Tax=Klenkia brasiliensis TaxID=333142 RepID=A0A1G7R599_9ACTN|nr:hypothetical protein [Klenkia brasiliensis]SDG05140.1 hypothetical protein SAMN05660324_1727 [Klenkia brasiliensis]
MHVDTARELKATLSRRLSEAAPGTVVASDAPGPWSGVALGLAPVGPQQVRLAVRLRTEADAAQVLDALDDAARAEVDVRVIGPVRPLRSPTPEQLQRRTRPLVPGLSVAHPDVTAGTLGGFVRRAGTDGLLVLSNNHVLANSDAAREGDPALQPGPADGGTAADRIGTLTAFQRFVATGNLVDAAVAALDDGVDADPAGYPGGPLLAQVLAAEEVDPDEVVEKVGRTTGHTRGRVTAVEVDGVGVQYDEGTVHTFDDQVEVEGLAGSFSEGGDSGSVIWRSSDRAPLGLLFAGSSTGGSAGGGVTFANPLATVLQVLGLTFVAGA